MTNFVNLTDAELALLDGNCSQKVQEAVDEAKSRLAEVARLGHLPPAIASLIADIRKEAETHGKIGLRYRKASDCRNCERKATYGVHKRTTKYHTKGATDWDNKIYIAGIDLSDRGIITLGHIQLGLCRDCFDVHRPAIFEEIKNLKAQIAPAWFDETITRQKIYYRVVCPNCNWTGYQNELINEHCPNGPYLWDRYEDNREEKKIPNNKCANSYLRSDYSDWIVAPNLEYCPDGACRRREWAAYRNVPHGWYCEHNKVAYE